MGQFYCGRVAYIFNREVASKDTEQCFLFWYRPRWRTMTTALVHSLDENWRFPGQQEKTATCRWTEASSPSLKYKLDTAQKIRDLSTSEHLPGDRLDMLLGTPRKVDLNGVLRMCIVRAFTAWSKLFRHSGQHFCQEKKWGGFRNRNSALGI